MTEETIRAIAEALEEDDTAARAELRLLLRKIQDLTWAATVLAWHREFEEIPPHMRDEARQVLLRHRPEGV